MRWLIFIATAMIAALPMVAWAEPDGEVINTGALPSGRKAEMLRWGATEKRHVVISYPKNFDPKELYHINFAFPGTDGTPVPGIEDQNDKYIGILMSYLDQPNLSNEQYAKDHWALCMEVEAALRKRVPFKVGQRIVSGVSKGGWLSFFMSVEAPDGLDGVCIIAAGRDMHTKKEPNLSRSGLSVLVCTGETDPNYPFAQLADAYFRKCGIRDYCYEEWLGKGHTSEISPRVQQWLDMVAMRGEPEEARVMHCEAQLEAAWENIKALPDILDQYRAVRHLMNSPFMPHVSDGFRAEIAAWGRELGEREQVVAWLKAYGRLRELVRAENRIYETGSVESEHLEKLDAGYRQLAETAGYPDIRARAAYAHVRNRKVITMLELRKKAQEQPEHQALENKARELFEQVSSSGGGNAPLMAEFEKVRRELGVKRGKLQMDSFYKVEWESAYVLDGKIKALLQAAAADRGHAAYSGVRY